MQRDVKRWVLIKEDARQCMYYLCLRRIGVFKRSVNVVCFIHATENCDSLFAMYLLRDTCSLSPTLSFSQHLSYLYLVNLITRGQTPYLTLFRLRLSMEESPIDSLPRRRPKSVYVIH